MFMQESGITSVSKSSVIRSVDGWYAMMAVVVVEVDSLLVDGDNEQS